MKVKLQPKHSIMAWVLLGTYALFWLLCSVHHFIAPEHQHETKVCHHAPNEKHFHGEEYTADDCSICQIALTFAELSDLQFPAFSLPNLITVKNNFGETLCLSFSLLTFSQPRAPPAPIS